MRRMDNVASLINHMFLVHYWILIYLEVLGLFSFHYKLMLSYFKILKCNKKCCLSKTFPLYSQITKSTVKMVADNPKHSLCYTETVKHEK